MARVKKRAAPRAPRASGVGRRPATKATAAPIDLREDPHSHIVCRSCGRIQRLELSELDRHFLTELAARRPAEWTVDGISFSLTGACQRCREGPSA